jgi:hypothetical protein
MPLTRDFKETIRARVKRDPGFRKALLREGIENFLSGDVETGKIILRDFINATVGFTKLSNATNRSAKSLMRMLGPRGNPQARSHTQKACATHPTKKTRNYHWPLNILSGRKISSPCPLCASPSSHTRRYSNKQVSGTIIPFQGDHPHARPKGTTKDFCRQMVRRSLE